MMQTLSLYWYLVRLQMRTKLEYRATLIIGWFAQAFGYASIYGTIWVIANRFETIGGWTWPQIALMLGFHVLGYALGAAFTWIQLRGMEDMVHRGNFDVLMVRPINPWSFLVFSGINIEYLGHISLGAGLIIWALPHVGIDWSILKAVQLGFSLISAALLTGAILTMIAALAFVFTRARQFFMAYFIFWEAARYPLTIFAWPLQIIMLSIFPLGFMAYVPVAALIDKPVPFLGPFAGLAAILVGPLMAVLAAWFWRRCLRCYQGGGG